MIVDAVSSICFSGWVGIVNELQQEEIDRVDIEVHYLSKKLVEFRFGNESSGIMDKKEAAQLAAELAKAIADLLGIDDE